jgi:hypothetical protein
VRAFKKINGKRYGRDANCQTGTEDVAYHLTEGRSTLTAAPIRRVPEILLDKLDTEGLRHNVRKAKRIGRIYSSNATSGEGRDKMVEQAMQQVRNNAKQRGWF